MTPDDLDAVEARYRLTDDAVDWRSESDVWETAAQVPDLVAALREAWTERDDAQRLNRLVLDQRDRIEAVLDRVRALCDETDRNAVVVEHAGDDVIITRAGLPREVSTAAVRAAIEGEASDA